MLPEMTVRKAIRGRHAGGEAIDRLVEGDTGMGWTVQKVEPNARVVFKEVQKEQVDACGCGLAGADGHLEERLDNTLVVNQEVNILLVNDVVVGGNPRQGTLKGRQLSVKGGRSEDPVRMFGNRGAFRGFFDSLVIQSSEIAGQV